MSTELLPNNNAATSSCGSASDGSASGVTKAPSGHDDEALSSLLLLLRSNQTNKDHSDGVISDSGDEGRGKRESFRSANIKMYSVEELRRYFHLPIVEVAKQLGICTTLLKKICRKSKINRWPYRQIRSITKSVQSLEMASLNETLMDSERERYREQINLLQNTLDLLIQDPNTPVVGQVNVDGFQALADFGEGLANHKPKTDVQAVLAAAAASASMEGSESINKRRKMITIEEQRQHEEDVAAVTEANAAPMSIGQTLSGHAIVAHNGKPKLKFLPPVQLAPLERRKMRSQKKLVPLIEPDICNFVHIDFLPRALLRLKSDKLDVTLQEVQQQLAAEAAAAVGASLSHEDGGMRYINVDHRVDNNHVSDSSLGHVDSRVQHIHQLDDVEQHSHQSIREEQTLQSYEQHDADSLREMAESMHPEQRDIHSRDIDQGQIQEQLHSIS